MRCIACAIAAALLAGCASTYEHQVVSAPAARLERGKSILIATPANGSYDKTVYQSSGQMTAGAARAAFARFSDRIAVSEKCADLDCLKGEAAGRDYLVVPEILHWEDRATEWSAMPDRISIKVTIYESGSGRILASTIFSGKSKWATMGGDHPQDLLPEPMNAYVGTLY